MVTKYLEIDISLLKNVEFIKNKKVMNADSVGCSLDKSEQIVF